MSYSGASRVPAVCAIAGSLLLFAGTFLHPQHADPDDPIAAFTEYAADHLWIASHLIQLAGIALMVAALLFLSHRLIAGTGGGWFRVAAGGASASLAITAALQAVDGVALKVMVDRWAEATGPQKELAFHAAFAVRQVEIGLASMMSILFGVTIITYGIALLVDRTYGRWFAWLGMAGGLGTTAGGIATAYTGFSGLAMNISMPASALLLVWMLILGVFLWRDSAVPAQATRG